LKGKFIKKNDQKNWGWLPLDESNQVYREVYPYNIDKYYISILKWCGKDLDSVMTLEWNPLPLVSIQEKPLRKGVMYPTPS